MPLDSQARAFLDQYLAAGPPRLAEAGVATVHECYDGQIHGFLRRTDCFDRANEAIDRIGQFIRQTAPVA